MKNLHLLPTNKPSRLYIGDNGNFVFGITRTSIQSRNDDFTNQDIYITSDEKIKKSDFFYVKTPNIHGGNIVTKCLNIGKGCWSEHILTDTIDEKGYHPSHCKKIILTTDQELIAEGVQPIDDEFLQWFMNNPSCEEIFLTYEYEQFNQDNPILKGSTNVLRKYEIIIPKEEPKQETLEEAAILNCQSITHPYCDREKLMFIKGAKWQEERMYSEEEVLEIIRQYALEEHLITSSKPDIWFEQFKKK
jgi:hypothetical protein